MTVKSLRGVKNTNKKKKQAGVGFSVEGRGGGLVCSGSANQWHAFLCRYISTYINRVFAGRVHCHRHLRVD